MNTVDRRSMLAGAAIGATTLASAGAEADSQTSASTTEVYELRTYQLVSGPMQASLDAYLEAAFIPAARRMGCGPVGAFTVAIGPESPSVHVLVPHRSIADFVALPARLTADPTYRKAAAPFIDALPDRPPYASLDVKLMRAFPRFPRLEIPDGASANKARIFELRTYHSHSEKAGTAKINMFDTGGEIEIFRRTGLKPVFFGQDLTGRRLPSLTYMLTFPDLAARERNWSVFGADPAWRQLSATAGLTNPDVVTSIDNQILSPTAYSQI